MSNPAVITLSSVDLSNNINFRIEDNIGECIHIHYANYRFDFSVDEFLAMEDLILDSIKNSFDIKNFNLQDYDPIFLASISSYLIDLRRIEYEYISPEHLKILDYKNKVPKKITLEKSIMYSALNGDVNDYLNFNQENYFEESNINRLNRVKKYVFDNDVENIKPIVLFNNQNFIRDGQHRSAAALKHGYNKLKVVRLFFNNNKYNISNSLLFDFLFKWNLERLKVIYRSMRKSYNSLKKRINYRIYLLSRKF